MKVTVFIVDDHYMVIEGIRSLLQHDKRIELSGHAASTVSCMAFLQGFQPDVILMDINLGDESGIDLCKTVKEKYPSINIIGLSTFNQQTFIQKMMENGASGYVLKNATQEELIEAILTVVKGKTYLSLEASRVLNKKVTTSIVLTRREKEVLELIADGLTNNEIAQRLFVSVSTVDTHRRNLLEKFEARNIASLVKIAMQQHLI